MRPLMDNAHLSGQVFQFRQDVGTDQHGLPHAGYLLQNFPHLNPGPRVQARRRFVQQQHFGVVNQAAGQPQTLLHPPG